METFGKRKPGSYLAYYENIPVSELFRTRRYENLANLNCLDDKVKELQHDFDNWVEKIVGSINLKVMKRFKLLLIIYISLETQFREYPIL